MIDTSAPLSPGWWLTTLAYNMQLRSSRLELLNSYLTGNAPLPEGAAGLREAFQQFQRKARINPSELIVEAVQERMTVSGFRIGDAEELSKDANRIWSYNELDTYSSDVHGDMLGLTGGYAIVGPPDDSGIPVITHEDPRLVITSPDPKHPSRQRAALKLFRDDITGKDTAYLYLPGVVYVAQRDNGRANEPLLPDISGFDWVPGMAPMRWPSGFEDVVPVVFWPNKNGVAEFERHTDTIDRINYVVLQRLVIIAMQAYRQRALKGSNNLPEVEIDADGNPVLDSKGDPIPIDLGAIMKPGPGSLWLLPEGVDLWESQSTDFTQVLAAAKDDYRSLAAETRTPIYMLMPDGANQSAEGASAAREQLVYKASDRIKRASYGWNQAMTLALRFAGVTANVVDMNTLWLPPERLSLAERADAASKLTAAGVPWKTIMTDIMQFPEGKVEEMETQRISDAMNTALTLPPAPVSGGASGV